jgi:hypothetical protein
MKKSYIKKPFFLIFVVVALSLGGCGAPASLNYLPSSAMTASGSLSVSDFKYMPAIEGKVKADQIRTNRLGIPIFDKNIDVFFKEAVFKEFRFVGIKMEDNNKILGGEIQEFIMEVGFEVDWTLRVKYELYNKKTGALIYETTKLTQRRTQKFYNPSGDLNYTVKLNIEELLKDRQFADSIK